MYMTHDRLTQTRQDLNFSIKKQLSEGTKYKLVDTLATPKARGFTIRKGDILITEQWLGVGGSGGFLGHAAIMADDYWVLEMPGGEGWQYGIEDNNRRISKHDWLKLHKSSYALYRNRDTTVAHNAADWAYRTYYNAHMGSEKTQHITYKLTNDILGTNPSYCSKLVIQAYHFGSGDRQVIKNFTCLDNFIVPTSIPSYFLKPYDLYNVKLNTVFEYVRDCFGS